MLDEGPCSLLSTTRSTRSRTTRRLGLDCPSRTGRRAVESSVPMCSESRRDGGSDRTGRLHAAREERHPGRAADRVPRVEAKPRRSVQAPVRGLHGWAADAASGGVAVGAGGHHPRSRRAVGRARNRHVPPLAYVVARFSPIRESRLRSETAQWLAARSTIGVDCDSAFTVDYPMEGTAMALMVCEWRVGIGNAKKSSSPQSELSDFTPEDTTASNGAGEALPPRPPTFRRQLSESALKSTRLTREIAVATVRLHAYVHQQYREQLVKCDNPKALSAKLMRTIYDVHEGSKDGAVAEIVGRHRLPNHLDDLVLPRALRHSISW